MLSQNSEDEIRSRFAFELAMWLWQDELNPRVRCAFGNVSLNDRKKAQGHHHLSLNIFENMWPKHRSNCTPVYYCLWWYPVGLQAKSNILNLWTWSSLYLFGKFGFTHSQKMDDITYCRNMHNLVWFLITDSGGFRFGLIWFLSLSFGENLECIFTLRHNVTQKVWSRCWCIHVVLL